MWWEVKVDHEDSMFIYHEERENEKLPKVVMVLRFSNGASLSHWEEYQEYQERLDVPSNFAAVLA